MWGFEENVWVNKLSYLPLSLYGFLSQGQITYFPLDEDFLLFSIFLRLDEIKQAKWWNNCLIVHRPCPKWRWMSVIQRSLGNCSQADQCKWLPLSEPVFDEFAGISISLQITNHFQILEFFIYLSYYESEVWPNCQKRSTLILLLLKAPKNCPVSDLAKPTAQTHFVR